MEILKQTYKITASDVDYHGRLRLSGLLNYLQNAATDHAEILGIDGARMIAEHNAFWAVARTELTLTQPIPFPGTLEIHTWHRGAGKGAAVQRDFDIFSNNTHIGEATMTWVLADLSDRSVKKPSSVAAVQDSPVPKTVKELVPQKIKLPQEMQQTMTRPVYYSDTDINRHMNNAKYIDIACDAIRHEQHGEQFIRKMRVNYQSECLPGDVIAVFTGNEAGTHYICGKNKDDKPHFTVQLDISTP